MSQSFSIRYRLTPADYLAFSSAYLTLTPWRRAVRWLVPVLVVVSVAIALFAQSIGQGLLAAYGLILAALLLFARFVVEPWSQRRLFGRQHLGDMDIEFHADSEGFSVKTADTNGKSKWSAIRRVDDAEAHVFLWPNERIGYIVPKSAFAAPAEAAAFAALAKEKTVGKTL